MAAALQHSPRATSRVQADSVRHDRDAARCARLRRQAGRHHRVQPQPVLLTHPRGQRGFRGARGRRRAAQRRHQRGAAAGGADLRAHEPAGPLRQGAGLRVRARCADRRAVRW